MPRHVTDSWRSYLGPGAVTSFVLALVTGVLGLGVPIAVELRRVLAFARRDERRSADAILVLGRALRNDRPTEVFAARLAHGASCFHAGLAPRVVVTGGLTGDARRTEAEAGRDDLVARGVPPSAVLVEGRSRHTLENLVFVRETLRAQGWRSVLLVSDPLHLARAATLARGLALEVACSPAHDCPPRPGALGWWSRALREAFFLHWYRVGVAYSRLIRSQRLLSRVT
jgi:uncharacterized SAM-binding protein YcdF (DUF218 family)